MTQFPSPLERTVASALFLLSQTPPLLTSSLHLTSPKFASENDFSIGDESKEKSACGESSVLRDSKSCSSSLTVDASSDAIQALRMKIIAVVARCKEMKVVRKSRSKVCRRSDGQEITSGKVMTSMSSESASTETSCLSSSSSAVLSARSRCVTGAQKKLTIASVERRRNNVSSSHVRRRAEAILKFLSGGCSSEVKIRQVLGDSPDTSKALRMLLKLEEVKRSGAGGRRDPYIYTTLQGLYFVFGGLEQLRSEFLALEAKFMETEVARSHMATDKGKALAELDQT